MPRTGRPKSTPRVMVECAGCGAPLERLKEKVENSKTGRFFCSKACELKIGANPRQGETVSCMVCGISFYRRPSYAGQTTCSRSCAAKARGYTGPRLQPVNCQSCGQGFQPKEKMQRFCSSVCRIADQERVITKICLCCKQPYADAPSRINMRFCSRKCQTAYSHVTKTCEFCNAPFDILRSALKTRPARFCSPECFASARRGTALDRFHNGKPAIVDSGGYILIWQPDHPNALCTGWIAEHRYVMSEHLGRPLLPDEDVHHGPEGKQCNDIENLKIDTRSDHARHHAQERARKARGYEEATAKLAEYERLFGPLLESKLDQ